jgi:hypothetical protein
MTFKKVISALLLLAMCVGILSSCAADTSPAVLTLDKYKITANMYNYWASTSKANFLSADRTMNDSPELWASQYAEGITLGQYCDSLIQNDLKKTLVCLKLFDEEKLQLSDETVKTIDEGIAMYLSEYSNGNKNEFNAALAKYGANMDILRNIYIAEAKREMLYNHLFGEGGKMALTDGAKEEYFQTRYCHMQIIYINDKSVEVTDEDGKAVMNADGTPATRALTEAEAKKKKETIEAVKSGLAAGEKFEDLYTKYSEMKDYENGYYYSVDASYVSTLFNKMAAETSKIEVGATTLMEEESGTYIIKRLENTEGDWKNEKFADFFHDFESIASLAAFAQYIEPYMSQITVNTEKIGAYSIDAVVPNYSF